MVSCYSPGDCTVHCPPLHGGILNGTTCRLAKSGVGFLPSFSHPLWLCFLPQLAWAGSLAGIRFKAKTHLGVHKEVPTCSLVCLNFHCGQWKSCWDSHEQLERDLVTLKLTHLLGFITPGAGFVWWSPGFPLARRTLCRFCAIPASLIRQRPGCLTVSFWATEYLMP